MSNIKLKSQLAVERGKRLRFLRDIVGMTLKVFSNECTIGLTTLIYWEKGTNILTERGAQKVIRAVRDQGITCTLVWLLEGIGESPKISDQTKLLKLHYPIRPLKIEHNLHESAATYTDSEFQKEIALFKQLGPDCLTYTVCDQSMQPIYQQGDCVGGYSLEKSKIELSHKKDCIVVLKEGKSLIRRIKLEDMGKLSLYVINAEASIEHPPLYHIPTDTISVVAPIIRVWKRNIFTNSL